MNHYIMLKRSLYLVLIMGTIVLFSSLGKDLMHYAILAMGLALANLATRLWMNRVFTIGIGKDGRAFAHCELCKDVDVSISGTSPRNCMIFAKAHLRKHLSELD